MGCKIRYHYETGHKILNPISVDKLILDTLYYPLHASRTPCPDKHLPSLQVGSFLELFCSLCCKRTVFPYTLKASFCKLLLRLIMSHGLVDRNDFCHGQLGGQSQFCERAVTCSRSHFPTLFAS